MLFFNLHQLFRRDANGDGGSAGDGDDSGNTTVDVAGIAAEAGLPSEVAELIDGSSEEGARRQVKFAAAIIALAQGGNAPKDDDGERPKPKGRANDFDPGRLGELLGRMRDKFGGEAINKYLAEDLGINDLTARQNALEMREARAVIADKYGLSRETIDELPASTPDELEAVAKAVVGVIEQREKETGRKEQTGGSLIRRRTISGAGKPKRRTIEEALEAFDHGHTAAEDMR